jgi:hypothetical protein
MTSATFIRAALLCVLLLLMPGCLTAPKPVTGRMAFVRLVSSRTAIVQGSRTWPSRVGAALKAAGAKPGTNVEILLAGDCSPATVATVQRSAIRAGFRNVVTVAAVNVDADGTVAILGKRLQLAQLGPRLTAIGAGQNTMVKISFAKNVSPETIRSVTQMLVRTGFPKIVVTRKARPKVSIQKK